jgi:hypothetical protein
MLSKRSGDDTLPPYKWRWGGIDYSISHLIILLELLPFVLICADKHG